MSGLQYFETNAAVTQVWFLNGKMKNPLVVEIRTVKVKDPGPELQDRGKEDGQLMLIVKIPRLFFPMVSPFNQFLSLARLGDQRPTEVLARYQEMAGRHRADPGSIQIIHVNAPKMAEMMGCGSEWIG